MTLSTIVIKNFQVYSAPMTSTESSAVDGLRLHFFHLQTSQVSAYTFIIDTVFVVK
jgi:hypothetical protein